MRSAWTRSRELQAPCLMQGQESLILNDGHSTSIVEALTTGPASDLAMEASFTPQLSYGYYSPYIASVLDIAQDFRLVPHGAVSIHSGARLAARRYACSDAQHAAVLPQPEVGAGRRRCRRSSSSSCRRCMPWIRRRSIARARARWCCRSKARRWCFPPAMRTT